jgi:hypothetical protein
MAARIVAKLSDRAAEFRIPMGSKPESDYETKWQKRPSLLTAIYLGD